MTKINLTYCGMAGEGPTVKEAKQDAARKIEAALNLDYTPRFVVGANCIGVIWATPSGVCTGYVRDGRLSGTCLHGGFKLETACNSVAYNIAQGEADVDSNEVPKIIQHDKELVKEYARWLAFQRAYKRVMADHPERERHDPRNSQWAYDHMHEFIPHL